MNRNTKLFLLSGIFLILAGCTSGSTKIAQQANVRVDAVKDGVNKTLVTALSREQYETAKNQLELNIMRAMQDMTPEQRKAFDVVLEKNTATLKEFARKRDMMLDYVRDNERANTLKAVTVDAKLFSEQGIVNYLVSQLTGGAREIFTAWDTANGKVPVLLPASQPSTQQ
jgi:hypothetical protein